MVTRDWLTTCALTYMTRLVVCSDAQSEMVRSRSVGSARSIGMSNRVADWREVAAAPSPSPAAEAGMACVDTSREMVRGRRPAEWPRDDGLQASRGRWLQARGNDALAAAAG